MEGRCGVVVVFLWNDGVGGNYGVDGDLCVEGKGGGRCCGSGVGSDYVEGDRVLRLVGDDWEGSGKGERRGC